MNHKKVIEILKQKYPGKKIIKKDKNSPTEIVCEIDPTENHKDYSIVIAVIDRSIPHYHKITTEIYEVIKGELTIYKNNKEHKLKPGDKLTILPNEIHYAIGAETLVKTTGRPGWTISDHIIISNK